MHSRFKYILIVLFLTISMLFNMSFIHADSGFDSSYDSGSWDSGDSYSSSDYSSSYDYGSSSSGSYSGGSYHMDFHYEGFGFVIICLVLGILGYKSMKKNNNKSKDLYLIVYIILCMALGNLLYGQKIIFTGFLLIYYLMFIIGIPYIIFKNALTKSNRNKIENKEDYFVNSGKFNELNTEKLQKELFTAYEKIQYAWANNNIEPVRNILSDELFNTYQMQIDSMIVLEQKNIMKDIEFKKMIVGNNVIKDNLEEITVIMEVTCKDYIVQNKNGKEVVIRGKEKYLNDYIYAMTFVRNIKCKLNTCPNCGTNLAKTMSSKCPSCNSVVVNETDHWVLTKKRMLYQTRR